MNAHQVRHRKIYQSLAESILKTYGFVPAPVMEDIAAHAIAEVTLYQAHHENWLREQAAKARYAPGDIADLVVTLHAPLDGGVAA